MNKNCNIVKDLLPSYAYELTTAETNKFVEEHLRECDDCRKNLENIKNEEKTKEEKKAKKYINFAKKYQGKLYILRSIIVFIIIIMIAIFLIPFIRKICIISNLSNKANKYTTASNVHIIKYSYNDNSYVKNEFWQKNNQKKLVYTSFHDGNVSNVQIYASKIDNSYEIDCYSETNGEKTKQFIVKDEFIGMYVQNIFEKDNFIQLLKASVFSTVKNTTFDGRECYYILNFDSGNDVLSNGIYIDKETGLIINEISHQFKDENHYPATSYVYEFDNVDDSVFIEPDISEYKVVEDN